MVLHSHGSYPKKNMVISWYFLLLMHICMLNKHPSHTETINILWICLRSVLTIFICLSLSEVTCASVTLVNGHADDCRGATPSPLISPMLNDSGAIRTDDEEDNRRKVRFVYQRMFMSLTLQSIKCILMCHWKVSLYSTVCVFICTVKHGHDSTVV